MKVKHEINITLENGLSLWLIGTAHGKPELFSQATVWSLGRLNELFQDQ